MKGSLEQVKPKGPTLRFDQNPEAVISSGGVGGWNRTPRPRRTPVTDWVGPPEHTISFTLIFDGWRFDGGPHKSVEHLIHRLERMGQSTGDGEDPPLLKFHYGHMGKGGLWVIDSLQPQEEFRTPALHRCFATIGVVLLRHHEGEYALGPVERHGPKIRWSKNSTDSRDNKLKGDGGPTGDDAGRPLDKGSTFIYRVRKGDTLASLARHYLGDAKDARVIARINHISVGSRLRPGQQLRIPKVRVKH